MAKPVPEQRDHSQIYEVSNRVARSTVAVIDTVVQRGGFKGEELTTIGQLRDQATQIIQICETFQSEQSKVDNKS
ncbi:MAG: hypothetical protein CM15mV16_0420 [uncultured marine virus]|jgi:hypothetical protein|nr:MAG: hypothetical protein CM15mV16_0420 [uncultured marine virus]|tara:strand:+ start:558 stop:782 length:225 start_codon:yes stop_codon:yes gene_type:complete